MEVFKGLPNSIFSEDMITTQEALFSDLKLSAPSKCILQVSKSPINLKKLL